MNTATGHRTVAGGGPAFLRGPRRPDLLGSETLPEILAATVRRRPEHPALIWQGQPTSYANLYRSALTIAENLQHQGAKPGAVIGLFLPRGADLLRAMAGITFSSSAWLPFDAGTPVERVQQCLASAGALGLVTCAEWKPKLAGLRVPVWSVEELLTKKNPAAGGELELNLDLASAEKVTPAKARPDDPAYVIYTSGSTGEPKGIVIAHRSICHFLRSENAVLGVTEGDKVYQGFSVAFDMSFEEIWISWLAGATVWVAPADLVADPEGIAAVLTREGITVLHAVPTLAGLLPEVPQGVRLLNLGGEACPPALAERLVRPGLKVFNTYGPTETTVTATLAELRPGESVTIGLPLPNYGVVVVDENRVPVGWGETGELAVFGPGLALGYLGRPDLTAQRFVANPVAEGPGEATMYLTGDLARMSEGGPVQCLGRADNQVKIRGFRVELDEISAVLNAQPGVGAGAVVMRPLGATEELVAFVQASGASQPELAALRAALAARLPGYMVPAHLERVEVMPRLASGKIDAKALKSWPLDFSETVATNGFTPRTEAETVLSAALEKLFPGRKFGAESDFFDDLGGHSLLVARLVSILRQDGRYASASVQDVYRERRIGAIAGALEKVAARRAEVARPRRPVPEWRRRWCGVAQGLVVPVFVLFNMADWLGPFFTYHYFTGDPGDSVAVAILLALGVFALARVVNFAIGITGKWLVARRLRPGRYPLWGWTYFRWWLGRKFCELPDTYLLSSTPWLSWYLRAVGARVGKDVLIDTVTIGAPELLTIGDGACVGTLVNLENARVEGGELILGRLEIGAEAVVESYSVMEENTEVGAGARLGGQSALAADGRVPAGERWEGVPARRVDRREPPMPPRPEVSGGLRWKLAMGHGVSALVVSVLFFLPVFPAFLLIDWVDAQTLDVFDGDVNPAVAFGYFFGLAIPAGALFLVVTAGLTAGLRWWLPPQNPGTFPVHSVAFWRKKFMAQILDASLRELHGLYASVYAPGWLRCLGMKVGKGAEVSTAEGMVPELLELGADCFIADGAMLGDEEQRGGWMTLRPTRVGNRSFVGNGAYVPDGTLVPDGVLIGVETRAPENQAMRAGQTWMGSPPMLLPAREQVGGFPEALTFRPSVWRRLGRALVEGLRIVLPLAFIIASGYTIMMWVMPVAAERGWGWVVAGVLALAGCGYGLASFGLVVGLKWGLMGKYQPKAAPMWTPFVWLSEAVTNLYESLAVPNLLEHLEGTPWLPWALRLLGARIGRGVYLDTTDLTEFDCVQIGDGAELNGACGPQTHLFEDRVMKVGRVEIGARVVLGARVTVLYDTQVGDDVRLGPLTLVAKGERLPAGTRWHGSPAAPLAERKP